MAKKATHKPKNLRRLAGILALGGLFIFILVASVSYGVYQLWHQHIEAGQFQVSDTFLGENLYTSLDLKVAGRASFPSSPVKMVQDLGVDNGVDRQHFSFDVKDDHLTEYGLVTLPTAAEPQNGYPAIILLHGFSPPRDYNTDTFYLPDMEFYSQHGFAVFKPDLRGLGLSIHSGHTNSAFYSMDYNTDVMSLISALKQSSLVDKSNISLWGHSMGAYIGLRAAVLSPDVRNLILLSGPVDSLTKMYVTYLPSSDAEDPYALATRNEVFAKYHPPNHDQFWTDASPINHLPKIKAKIEINVGLADRTVSPEFSADLDAALTRDRIAHQYFAYAGGKHSLLLQRDMIWSRSLQLLTGS
ncbi:MAG TPA: alpha/beta fold hydrolase [Candidatus Saccharimonadales bacterium]|nr:alpha/beta fold hydrolase [Candidatus Saccharimonadales bacterium]